jgi:hypothetical protein
MATLPLPISPPPRSSSLMWLTESITSSFPTISESLEDLLKADALFTQSKTSLIPQAQIPIPVSTNATENRENSTSATRKESPLKALPLFISQFETALKDISKSSQWPCPTSALTKNTIFCVLRISKHLADTLLFWEAIILDELRIDQKSCWNILALRLVVESLNVYAEDAYEKPAGIKGCVWAVGMLAEYIWVVEMLEKGMSGETGGGDMVVRVAVEELRELASELECTLKGLELKLVEIGSEGE